MSKHARCACAARVSCICIRARQARPPGFLRARGRGGIRRGTIEPARAVVVVKTLAKFLDGLALFSSGRFSVPQPVANLSGWRRWHKSYYRRMVFPKPLFFLYSPIRGLSKLRHLRHPRYLKGLFWVAFGSGPRFSGAIGKKRGSDLCRCCSLGKTHESTFATIKAKA